MAKVMYKVTMSQADSVEAVMLQSRQEQLCCSQQQGSHKLFGCSLASQLLHASAGERP